MSIVIATIDTFTNTVYMYGDKRRAVSKPDGSFEFTDDIEKVFRLTKSLMLGVTGSALLGHSLYNHLNVNNHLSCEDLLKLADSADISTQVINGESYDSTFMIAGVNDDGEQFIWSKSTSMPSETMYSNGQGLPFSCATKEPSDVLKAQNAFMSILRCNPANGQITNFSEAISKAINEVSLTNQFVSAKQDQFKVSA